jgi:predicted ATPase
LQPFSDEMREALRRVLTIDPVRGKDLITTTTGESLTTGRHGEKLLQLLTTLSVRRGKTFERFRLWAKDFGLASLEAGTQNNVLDLSALDADGTPVRFTEFATGSLQGILIAAQVLLAPPQSVLLIEEPEANMHPAYEKLLAELFAEGVSLGHQIILTTHSEILVAAMGGLVRKGLLTVDQLAIIEMSRGKSSIQSRTIEVTERGLAEWVSSFSKVESALSQEWVNGIPEE